MIFLWHNFATKFQSIKKTHSMVHLHNYVSIQCTLLTYTQYTPVYSAYIHTGRQINRQTDGHCIQYSTYLDKIPTKFLTYNVCEMR